MLPSRLCRLSIAGFCLVFGPAALRSQNTARPPVRAPSGVLAPGDDVIVAVFQEKELSARVYVDDRSQIALPRLGVLDVGSLTSDMLRDTVRARYSEFLRDPSVDVRALRRITVNGSVLKPDVYFVDPSMALRDVIARSGGVTSEGDPKKVKLVRGVTSTSYSHWTETAEGETQLRSGDEVVVGRRAWYVLNAGALLGVAGLVTTLAITFVRH
jgi:polysaccharide export outer membrane protein